VATCVSGCGVCTECRTACDFVGEKNLNVIKMHGTTIKILPKYPVSVIWRAPNRQLQKYRDDSANSMHYELLQLRSPLRNVDTALQTSAYHPLLSVFVHLRNYLLTCIHNATTWSISILYTLWYGIYLTKYKYKFNARHPGVFLIIIIIIIYDIQLTVKHNSLLHSTTSGLHVSTTWSHPQALHWT
jgi:hypothetical protein